MKWSVIKRKLARVDRALDKSIDRAEIPGAVVLACMPRHGELVEFFTARGHAVVRPERIPMSRETVFDLASLTKPIATTTAVMLLVAEGAFGLDDPVAAILPAFAERDKEQVTFRHLLTHSAGLRPWRAFHELLIEKQHKTGERQLGTPEGRAWIVDRVLRSGLVHEVGAAAVYGDLDFIALAAAVEKVSGQTLDAFCEERIFGPLGLTDTHFYRAWVDGVDGYRTSVDGVDGYRTSVDGVDGATAAGLPPELRRRMAATENCAWRDRILWGEVHDPNASAMGGVAGHAGLFSTADDVMRFARTFTDVWHGRSDALPRELVLEFSRRQHMPEGSDWALGWDTPSPDMSSSGQHFSAGSVGHLGFTGTSLWIDLEREVIVVMLTNRVHLVAKRSRFELRPEVHDLIIDAFLSG